MPGYKRKSRSQGGCVRKAARPMTRSFRGNMSVSSYVKNAMPSGSYWAFSDVTTQGFWRQFSPTFGQLGESAIVQSLFANYKVDKVKISFLPRYGDTVAESHAGPGSITSNQFYVSIGRNSGAQVTPAGLYNRLTYNAFLEDQEDVKVFKADKPFSYTFKPNVQNTLTAGGIEVKRAGWISTASPEIPMVGAGVFIHDPNFSSLNGALFGMDYMFTFWFRCKGAR